MTERNVDQRNVADGGSGASARPMLALERGGFVDQHDCWSETQFAAAGQLRRVIDELGLDRVRVAFVDQHGLFRGKTITREALPAVLRDGLTVPSSLLLKDTSGRSVFPVFTAAPMAGRPELAGASDVVLVPDPTTFRVLPWTPRTGWLLCDLRYPTGSVVTYCTRGILRTALASLATRGFGLTVGVELEFHVFRSDRSQLSADEVAGPGQPGAPADISPSTPGAQLLHEEGLDGLDDLVVALQHGLTRLDLPLRSIELEFGHSQLEITLSALDALAAADAVVLARTAIRQIARRLGFKASFMARPAGAASASVGWHVHQSLRSLDSGDPAFVPEPHGSADSVSRADGPLSPIGRHYLAGLLANAVAATAFTTPTVNGYKRYSAYSLAPDRINWGIDNKGAMVRAVGGPGDPATRLENRSPEPAANPYLAIAAQVVSGIDGLDRALDPPPPTVTPYDDDSDHLPRTLAVAVDALQSSTVFRSALGDDVVDWYAAIKWAEWDRYLAHVSDWEQREYLGLF